MRRSAFTLIELLVVIAIISTLMAILLPSLGRVRQQGRQTYCLSNLRQMVLAAQMYAQAYDGYYPIAHYRQRTGSARYEHCWDFTTIKDLATNEEEVIAGLLWGGQTIEKIQQCPSFKGESNTPSDPYTGYNYNTSYIGHGGNETVSGDYRGEIRTGGGMPSGYMIVMPVKIYNIRRPARCAIFGDGQWSNGANKFMRAPRQWDGDTDNSVKAAGTQGYRHAGKTNVAWCDGHTSSQSRFYTETVPEEKLKLDRYNDTTRVKIGFLSPDNSTYELD